MKKHLTEQQIIRREKLQKLISIGVNPYNKIFNPTISATDFIEKYQNFTKEYLENVTDKQKLYGRIMMLRNQGKAAFLSLKQNAHNFQIYLKQEEIPELDWKIFELLDLGDIIGVEGTIMKTNTGHVTLRVVKLSLLSKALTPLPDKFKGLEDIEEIYRRRYLDLIMNDDSMMVFQTRARIIEKLRNYLDAQGFLEVETPVLTSVVSGAMAKPFHTHHNALDMDLTLRIATELPLKRLIVGGFEKVYEIGRIFRNEGISNRHNPEFTSIELYKANSDVNDMMLLTENIINNLAHQILNKEEIEYDGAQISLKKPFARIEMNDIIKQECDVDFSQVATLEQAKEIAKKHNVHIEKNWTSKGYVMNAFFETFCESKLINPTFITGYPVEVSPLAKYRNGSKDLTDRFELFINKREYANGYSELTDPQDQEMRFHDQISQQAIGNDEANDFDHDFIEALEYGLPATGGLGIGIDRLVMLLTNSHSIRDVILFPLQRRRNND